MATIIQAPKLRVSVESTPLPTVGIYPTSPLARFPPPVPALRRPLRERCGFNAQLSLTIKTSFGQQQPCADPWSPKGHTQPHRNHLPRRRKANIKRIVLDDDEPEHAAPAAPGTPGALVPAPGPADASCLQEVIPGLFIAFKTTSDAVKETAYTHIIDVCHPPPGYDAGATEKAFEGRIHRLRLVLPEPSPPKSGRAGLALTETQLRAARDFLAETLPYSTLQPPAVLKKQAVRVLISTPQRRPTDAMSIVGCYLAFVSKKSVDTALRCIDDEPEFLSIWKGEVSEDELARAERVARMRSWLSGIKR
ncbi:hypothetical protein C8Q72DRAFT_817451 [Fomitopsis betulina]|nr:hypothetical protein C8Q72DRAFT_817451 [Fomitopsis betulina]